MVREPRTTYTRMEWAILATLGLVVVGVLLTLPPLLGLGSAIILGLVVGFLLAPDREPAPGSREASSQPASRSRA